MDIYEIRRIINEAFEEEIDEEIPRPSGNFRKPPEDEAKAMRNNTDQSNIPRPSGNFRKPPEDEAKAMRNNTDQSNIPRPSGNFKKRW